MGVDTGVQNDHRWTMDKKPSKSSGAEFRKKREEEEKRPKDRGNTTQDRIGAAASAGLLNQEHSGLWKRVAGAAHCCT
ncbi:hypothetical protein ACER0C_008545 [Sarotherodon galilaeus]